MDKGIKELNVLLSRMEPSLDEETYIFHTMKQKDGAENILHLNPLGFFKEKEGFSLILSKEKAEEAGIAFDSVFSLISLTVHSSLNAVGLTAAISTKLAQKGISANVVAGYYHDHVFVPEHKTEAALAAIQELQSQK